MTNKARLDKQRREERALARIAKEHRERELAKISETSDGRKLLALVDGLRAVPLLDWPGLVAAQHAWLRAMHPDFRTTAIRLIGDVYDECVWRTGRDPLDEPLTPPMGDQEPSAFQQIRWALAALPASQPAPCNKIESPKIMLTIQISGPKDVAALRETIGSLHGLLFGTTAPVALATSAQATEDDAPRTRGTTAEEAAEQTKRKRRTKAEMDADAAKEAAAQQPQTTPTAEPAADDDDLDALLDDGPAEPTGKTPWDHCYTTTYTPDEANKAFREWALKAGGAATRHVLSHLKVTKSSEIKADQYSELMALLIGKPI